MDLRLAKFFVVQQAVLNHQSIHTSIYNLNVPVQDFLQFSGYGLSKDT